MYSADFNSKNILSKEKNDFFRNFHNFHILFL